MQSAPNPPPQNRQRLTSLCMHLPCSRIAGPPGNDASGPFDRTRSRPIRTVSSFDRGGSTHRAADKRRVAGKRSLYHHNKRSFDHHSREHNRNWSCSCKRDAQQLFLLQRRQCPPPLRDKFHGWHKFRDKLHGGQHLRDALLHERDALLHERLHEQKHRSM